MTTTWLFSQLHWQQPGFWLLISFLSSLALWGLRIARPSVQRQPWHLASRILVPYLGLLSGALSPRLMGLSDLDWLAGLGVGVILIFSIGGLLVLIRITLGTERGNLRQNTAFFDVAVGAGVQEFHWTFLRAATWEILLAAPTPVTLPGYWAVWIASLLALPGIYTQYRTLPQRLIAVVVLITTAILFFYTRNFWLGWLLHSIAQLLLGQRPLYQQPVRSL